MADIQEMEKVLQDVQAQLLGAKRAGKPRWYARICIPGVYKDVLAETAFSAPNHLEAESLAKKWADDWKRKHRHILDDIHGWLLTELWRGKPDTLWGRLLRTWEEFYC